MYLQNLLEQSLVQILVLSHLDPVSWLLPLELYAWVSEPVYSNRSWTDTFFSLSVIHYESRKTEQMTMKANFIGIYSRCEIWICNKNQILPWTSELAWIWRSTLVTKLSSFIQEQFTVCSTLLFRFTILSLLWLEIEHDNYWLIWPGKSYKRLQVVKSDC